MTYNISEWLNSPDIQIDYDHSDPRLQETAVITTPATDQSIVNLAPQAGNIPVEYAMKQGASGTGTEIKALFFVDFVLGGQYVKYEPMSFSLPSGRYTPDIYTILDGLHCLFEVKPSGWKGFQKNTNASIKSVKELAFHWGWMYRIGYLVKNKKADIKSGSPEFSITWIGEA